MGGSVKKAVNTVAPIVNPVGYVGTRLAMGNKPGAIAGDVRDAYGNLLGARPQSTGADFGPLNINMDPYGDQAAIEAEGQRQYGQSQDLMKRGLDAYYQAGQKAYGQDTDLLNQDVEARQAARDKLAGYLQEQARNTFSRTLPGVAEDYNAGGLLNSTGYQQEVARRQADLAADVANQLGQYGLRDVDLQSQAKRAALDRLQGYQDQSLNYGRNLDASNLAGLQGYQGQGLQRVFGLQDYAREANVAKQIGAQMAPKTGGGKAGTFSGALGGLGTGAAAGAKMGNPVAGGIGGGILGALGGK